MRRTQISLSPEDLRALKKAARAQEISMAAVIRDLIEKHVRNGARRPPVGAALLRLAKRAIRDRGPRNLSEKIHEELYGPRTRWPH